MTDHLAGLRIEPIGRQHRRENFDCGEPTLNEYLLRYARQNHINSIAKAFVAIDEGKQVHGYYTLSAASVEFAELPEAYKKRLPRYPAARIGRLAVDMGLHGKGLGEYLLIDALQRVLGAADEIGVKIVLVDTLNKRAKAFYSHYGFSELPEHPMTLFLPIETIEQVF